MRRITPICAYVAALFMPQVAQAQVHWDNTMQTFVDGRVPDNTPSPYRDDRSLHDDVGVRTGDRDGQRLGKSPSTPIVGSVTSQAGIASSGPKLP